MSWIFRQFWPEKRGDFEKKKEGLWLQTLFRLIGKQGKSEEGENQTPRINKRKNANFMALLFPNIIKFYIGFSAVFN